MHLQWKKATPRIAHPLRALHRRSQAPPTTQHTESHRTAWGCAFPPSLILEAQFTITYELVTAEAAQHSTAQRNTVWPSREVRSSGAGQQDSSLLLISTAHLNGRGDACGYVRDTHGALRGVDVLPTSAARTEHVEPKVAEGGGGGGSTPGSHRQRQYQQTQQKQQKQQQEQQKTQQNKKNQNQQQQQRKQ